MKKQTGFTLIELIMVIVIIGILAAVAIPKYIDLTAQAYNATANGIGASLASASVINYANKKAGGTFTSVSGCTNGMLAPLLAGGSIPTGATIGGTASGIADGASGTCTVTMNGGGSAQNFTIIGAP